MIGPHLPSANRNKAIIHSKCLLNLGGGGRSSPWVDTHRFGQNQLVIENST